MGIHNRTLRRDRGSVTDSSCIVDTLRTHPDTVSSVTPWYVKKPLINGKPECPGEDPTGIFLTQQDFDNAARILQHATIEGAWAFIDLSGVTERSRWEDVDRAAQMALKDIGVTSLRIDENQIKRTQERVSIVFDVNELKEIVALAGPCGFAAAEANRRSSEHEGGTARGGGPQGGNGPGR